MITAKTLTPLTLDSIGTYISVEPTRESISRLCLIARLLGIETDEDELHCTLMYAPGSLLPNGQAVADYNRMFYGTIDDITVWGSDTKYLVVIMKSPQLLARHKEWLNKGLVHTFHDYTPHVTLAKNPTQDLVFSIAEVLPNIKGSQLAFSHECIEGIHDPDEKPKVQLKMPNSDVNHNRTNR